VSSHRTASTTDGNDGSRTYRPSPRPRFDGPAAIPYANVTRHIWGDAESGEVFDWIYASTDLIHTLVFGLAPSGSFLHSREFRTVFGADEALHVLNGTMILANPQTGEVIRVPTGESALLRAGTWHHAFAHGPEPLRVLEFLAPPPSAGTTGAYARTREYLEQSTYHDDTILGRFSGADAGPAKPTLHRRGPDQLVYRMDGDAIIGLIVSTEHLTAASLSLPVSATSTVHAHAGDEIIYVTDGALTVRVWHDDATHVFELGPRDAAYVPAEARHEYRNYGGTEARGLLAVAPSFAAPADVGAA
jgi:quercetin dioxygenase-like cupin family protein